MERSHHNVCRCNDCIARRNFQRQRFAGTGSRGSGPHPAGTTLYEVPGDHAATFEDDVRPLGTERPASLVGVRNYADDHAPAAFPERGDTGTDVYEFSEETIRRPLPAETASIQEGHGYLAAMPEANEGAREGSPAEADGEPAWPRAEVDILHQEIISVNPETQTAGQISAATPIPDGIHTDGYPGPEDDLSAPDAEGSRRNRRRFALPLILALILVAAIVGVGVLATVLLSSSREAPTAEAEEPTPDVGATVSAAVAMAVAAQLTPGPANPSDGGEATTLASTEPGSASLPQSPPLPPTISGYVDWEQRPAIMETGHLVFKARIDDGANFKPAGQNCGFANVSLTDNTDASFGSILPRSMAMPCGAGLGDWVSDQYYYSDSLLTVTVQLSAGIAAHPGLMVCLWTGGATDEENRLLDCASVLQP